MIQQPTPEQQPFHLTKLSTWPTWAKITAPISAVLLVALFCSCCALSTAATFFSPSTSTSAQQATATAAPTQSTQHVSFPTAVPTIVPTATATPDTRAATYKAYVLPQLATLKADFTDIGNNCDSNAGGTLSDCRAAMQETHTDVLAFQNGLKTHPAPPCLSAADKHLRTALADYARATQLAMDGIDQYDIGKIDQAGDLITAGNNELGAATDATDSAIC